MWSNQGRPGASHARTAMANRNLLMDVHEISISYLICFISYSIYLYLNQLEELFWWQCRGESRNVGMSTRARNASTLAAVIPSVLLCGCIYRVYKSARPVGSNQNLSNEWTAHSETAWFHPSFHCYRKKLPEDFSGQPSHFWLCQLPSGLSVFFP